MIFSAFDVATDLPAVWISDGTAKGTTILADLSPIGRIGDPKAIVGNDLYFGQTGPAFDTLWRTDGTHAGTGELTTLPSAPSAFTVDGQTLFFTADDSHGNELWAAQTPLLNLSTGPSSGPPGSPPPPPPVGSSPTPTPISLPIHTVITGELPLFERKLNKKHKPTGKPVLSGFSLDLDVALTSALGTNSPYIELDTIISKRIKNKKMTILHPISNFTVSYLAASDELRIIFQKPQTFPTGGQLTVHGGMTTATGAFLSGTEVFTISKGGKSLSPSRET